MIRVFTLIFLLIIGSLTPKVYSQTKRALVIGIGQQKDTSWGKINGDKDIPYVVSMLKDARFNNIYSLENEKATKDKIVSCLRDLSRKAQKGDIIYIHFSGHGQQMTDVEGDEITDRWDECWIPYDAYSRYSQYYTGKNHLTDDEIFYYINQISKKIGSDGKLLLVVDACHSGDSYYDNNETIRGTTRKFIVPRSSTNLRSDKVTSKTKYNNWIMLSACKEYEVNTEMKEPHAGKLTYALYVLLKNNKTYMNESLLYKIKLFMNKHSGNLPQTPEYGGDVKAFNISEIFVNK